jgi:hypothetical protein
VLPALVVPVEEVDRERLGVVGDRLEHFAVEGILGIAWGRLPAAGVAAGDVEVALLVAEVLDRAVFRSRLPSRPRSIRRRGSRKGLSVITSYRCSTASPAPTFRSGIAR